MPNINYIFTGWRRIINVRHYFRNGKSLCSNAHLFADAPNLSGGKECNACWKKLAGQKAKAA